MRSTRAPIWARSASPWSATPPTAPAVLNASGAGAASYTSIGISPSGGAARTISGAIAAGSPLIDLNGADNVTIDGLNTGGNSLTIANTTVSATSGTSTIRFIGGATSNVITNSNIQGASTSSVATNGGTIFFSTDAVTANGNDNNTISNNNIGPVGANLPSKAILGNGSTTTTAIGNSGIVINNNNIFDYFGAAVTSAGIATIGGCNTWSITNNRFYQTGTRTWTTGSLHAPMNIGNTTATSGAQGFTITGNIVGFASNTQDRHLHLDRGWDRSEVHRHPVQRDRGRDHDEREQQHSGGGQHDRRHRSGTTSASPFTAILFQEGNLIPTAISSAVRPPPAPWSFDHDHHGDRHLRHSQFQLERLDLQQQQRRRHLGHQPRSVRHLPADRHEVFTGLPSPGTRLPTPSAARSPIRCN